jgi:ferredoxin--NADP+ reductase
MAAFDIQHVLSVHHWNDTLFSFKTTRGQSLRFESGQFVMIGLEVDGRPLLRAYSIASAHYAEHLEFFSIKVSNGALTSRLQHLRVGDPVLVGCKPTGTLILSDLLPGRHLYLLATGTGLAPFMSIIRDPEVYERFGKVVLVHGVREASDLAYAQLIEHDLPRDEFLGEAVTRQLIYLPVVTREAFRHQGRLPDLIASGALAHKVRLAPMDPALDRAMVCGGSAMLRDTRDALDKLGFACSPGLGQPGGYVIERAFVER